MIFFFILSVIALLISWVMLGFSFVTKNSEEKKSSFAGSFVVFFIALVLGFISCIRIVPANSIGIPVTFGSIGHSIDSGFHITSPFTKVHTFSTRLQESSMLGDPTEGDRKTDDAVDVRGSDEGVVYLDVIIRYTVSPDTASELFRRTGSMEGVREKIIRPDARSILRDVAKNFVSSDLVAAKRSEVEKQTSDILKQRMKDSYGINIDAVLLRGVRPSEQVERAIQAKITKAQEVEQALLQQQKEATEAETRNKVAQTDAATAKTAAQGKADAARIAAQGDADANAKIAQSLTPEILQTLKTEALKNGTVYVVPDGANFILGDLTKK